MKLIFTDEFISEYQKWLKSQKSIAEKINKLIESIKQNPFAGIGKPEPLKKKHDNWWSRRITKKDRLVYSVEESYKACMTENAIFSVPDEIEIILISCKGHYE